MPAPSTLWIFVVASVALLITPGPAVVYIVSRSIEQGRAAGLVSVLGICTGTSVHVVAAALGLSTLLASSPVAFDAVRYLGAIFLIGLGLQTIFRRDRPEAVAIARGTLRSLYVQGVVVNILNPKVVLFVFAFLPQFVDRAQGAVPLQLLGLGMLFVLISLITDAGWAIAAGTAGEWIRRHPRYARSQRYVTGGALIGLGAAAALTGGRKI